MARRNGRRYGGCVAPPIGDSKTVNYRGNYHKRSKGDWIYIDDDPHFDPS